MNISGDFLEDSTAQEVLLQRLWENGFPNVSYTPLAIYTKSSKYGKIFSTPFFSSINFLAYAINRRPFDLAVHATAAEVLHENGGVKGLRVMTPDLKSYKIRAKYVILTTSALENPRILLNSRIPGPAIGHYLLDQTFIEGLGSISIKEFPEIPGTVGILNPTSADQPFQIQFFRAPWFGYQQFQNVPHQESLDLHLQGFGKIHSRYENRVFLDPYKKDIYGIPLAQVQFSYHPDDYKIVQQMTVTIKQMLSSMGVTLKVQPGQSEFCMSHEPAYLRNKGLRIGMIERGNLLVPTHARNISTLDYDRFERFNYDPNISKRGKYPEFRGAVQVFALGGRTLFWATETPRMAPFVLQQWPVTLQEMELYYGIINVLLPYPHYYEFQK